MNERVTIDKVCDMRPVDACSVGIANGLIGGALYAFIQKLTVAGVDQEQLRVVLSEFENENGLMLSEGDVRFWDSLVDGILQYRKFGPFDLGDGDVRKLTSTPARIPKSRLQSLEHTLPPYKEGRDRKVQFQDDGTIVYAKEEGDWEPPREINGYSRNPQDPWTFYPLWPECMRQYGIAVRKPACGCIDIVMRCTCAECPRFRQLLKHTDCFECGHRQEPQRETKP
jgi:hypothetical protein